MSTRKASTRSGTAPRRGARKKLLGRYKSSLEKYCADKLSESGISFTYEVEYSLQESFRYDGVYWKMTNKAKGMTDKTGKLVFPIRYTPDFIGTDHAWIIETKGYNPNMRDFNIRWKMFLNQLVKSGEKLPALFIPKNKQQIDETVRIIKQLIDDGEI